MTDLQRTPPQTVSRSRLSWCRFEDFDDQGAGRGLSDAEQERPDQGDAHRKRERKGEAHQRASVLLHELSLIHI